MQDALLTLSLVTFGGSTTVPDASDDGPFLRRAMDKFRRTMGDDGIIEPYILLWAARASQRRSGRLLTLDDLAAEFGQQLADYIQARSDARPAAATGQPVDLVTRAIDETVDRIKLTMRGKRVARRDQAAGPDGPSLAITSAMAPFSTDGYSARVSLIRQSLSEARHPVLDSEVKPNAPGILVGPSADPISITGGHLGRVRMGANMRATRLAQADESAATNAPSLFVTAPLAPVTVDTERMRHAKSELAAAQQSKPRLLHAPDNGPALALAGLAPVVILGGSARLAQSADASYRLGLRRFKSEHYNDDNRSAWRALDPSLSGLTPAIIDAGWAAQQNVYEKYIRATFRAQPEHEQQRYMVRHIQRFALV